MTVVAATSRPFVPGTTGWTAHELENPETERQWFAGRYEIVKGVLTTMPPAHFPGTRSLLKLVVILSNELDRRGLGSDFGGEVDIIIDDDRVLRADAAWLTPEDLKRQAETARRQGRTNVGRTRILVPPTLVIETISPGLERHDERTKREWYAEFGVPNYWILDGFSRSLKCLVLDGTKYRVDCEGRGAEEVRPSLLPGLTIALASLWLEI